MDMYLLFETGSLAGKSSGKSPTKMDDQSLECSEIHSQIQPDLPEDAGMLAIPKWVPSGNDVHSLPLTIAIESIEIVSCPVEHGDFP